jgi:hypothetical protein
MQGIHPYFQAHNKLATRCEYMHACMRARVYIYIYIYIYIKSRLNNLDMGFSDIFILSNEAHQKRRMQIQ